MASMRRSGLARAGRVGSMSGTHRRHAEGRVEQREKREGRQVHLVRFEVEMTRDLLQLRGEIAVGVDDPLAGPVLPVVKRMAAGSSGAWSAPVQTASSRRPGSFSG